jgi:hypothetical protein
MKKKQLTQAPKTTGFRIAILFAAKANSENIDIFLFFFLSALSFTDGWQGREWS